MAEKDVYDYLGRTLATNQARVNKCLEKPQPFPGRFSVESIEWRDYHSKWHRHYWDLVYKKDSIVSHYRELNLWQAARIMELELQLSFHKQRWEDIKPEIKASLGLAGSKYAGIPDE